MSNEEDYDEEMDTGRGKTARKTKGRGFKKDSFADDRYSGKADRYDQLEEDEESKKSNALKSVEGWILFVSNVHEEAQEDDVYDLFADYGEIKQLHLNLDRRTGYVKGYALIEYGSFKEAQAAIDSLNNHALLEQEINVDWAFKKPPMGARRGAGARRR